MIREKKWFCLFDLIAFAVVAVGLLAGIVLLSTRSRSVTWNGVTLEVPVSLHGRILTGQDALVLREPFSRSPNFSDRIRLIRVPLEAVTNGVDPVHAWRQEQFQKKRMYREIDGSSSAIQGKNWVQFEYAYVVDPDTGNPGQDARPPVVVQGIARMFRKQDGRTLFVLSYDCDSQDYRRNLQRALVVFDSLDVLR